jgi:hypothetical protein
MSEYPGEIEAGSKSRLYDRSGERIIANHGWPGGNF